MLPGSWLFMPPRSRAWMFVNSDFSDLLRLFNDNSVKYLGIGGYAVIRCAKPRLTKDLVSKKKRPPFRASVGPEMRSPGGLPLSYSMHVLLSRGIF